jgi:hypothetical protein
MKAPAIEIEIDGPHNEALHFRPLQRSVRGRFDLNRMAEPMARMKSAEWPLPIPSQRIGIDPDGTGYIVEPLHEPGFAPIRERIEKAGQRLEPALQTFDAVHLPTWLFWICRAVQCGIARVVSGKLPDKIEGTPTLNFITGDPPPTPADKLTAALERQAAAFEGLTAAIIKMVEARK